MANSKLAQLLRISQQLTYQFYDINYELSKAWHALELARGNLSTLATVYNEWLVEEGFSKKEQE